MAGMKASAEGKLSAGELEALFEQAVSDTIRELEATGSIEGNELASAALRV